MNQEQFDKIKMEMVLSQPLTKVVVVHLKRYVATVFQKINTLMMTKCSTSFMTCVRVL